MPAGNDDVMVGVVRRRIMCPGEWPLPDEAFWDSLRLYFHPSFLANPDQGWTVHWNKRGRANPDPMWWSEQGTLVKLEAPARVWKLTGYIDESTRYLEGVWPD